MLRLRLQRRGKRNYATYRVVVADQRAPVKGRFVADVGYYNPHTNKFQVKAEQITDWLAKGVQPTPTIHNLLITHNIIKGEKVSAWRPKVKKKEAGEEKDKPDTPKVSAETKSDSGSKDATKEKSDSK